MINFIFSESAFLSKKKSKKQKKKKERSKSEGDAPKMTSPKTNGIDKGMMNASTEKGAKDFFFHFLRS